jgi:hypothetical protein
MAPPWTVIRLSVDKTLEKRDRCRCTTDSRAARELIIVVGHKLLYAVVTGAVTARVIGRRLAAVHSEEGGQPRHSW